MDGFYKSNSLEKRKHLTRAKKFKALHEHRLKAIKSVYASDVVYCEVCKRRISLERYWAVARWAAGKTHTIFNVCKHCASSESSVLAIVDSDSIRYGIAFVDDFLDYEKTSQVENQKLADNLFLGFLYNPYSHKKEYENGTRR